MFDIFEENEFSPSKEGNFIDDLSFCNIDKNPTTDKITFNNQHINNNLKTEHNIIKINNEINNNNNFNFANKNINNNKEKEMVAQDMAQSYDQLFHAAQEPPGYISLDGLRQIVHNEPVEYQQNHNIITSSIDNTNFYLDDHDNEHQNQQQLQQQLQHQQQQQRTYYNLAALPNDRIDNVIIQSDNTLASLTCTPESLVSSFTTAENDHSVNNDLTNIGKIRDISSSSIIENNSMTMFVNRNTNILHKNNINNNNHHRGNQQNRRQYHHRQHHRNYQRENSNSDNVNDHIGVSNKRKISNREDIELMDDGTDDSKSVRTSTDNKKQNHSEIEKRRRDKMNTYITELSGLVPMCYAMSRKLDKLTVLRMAVQHMKTMFGTTHPLTKGQYKPKFISDQELKRLILQAAEGFVFVIGCEGGEIIYVSESVSKILNYSQEDLLGQSMFDILHPKDVEKMKEQFSRSDLKPRERLIDSKTMLPVKTDFPQGVSKLCPGARRSFFCRMRRKIDTMSSESQIKEETDSTIGCSKRKKQQNSDWKYCVIQCTGYLKSWTPEKIGTEQEHENEGIDGEASNLSCLVAVGRIQAGLLALSLGTTTPRQPTIEFVSRHGLDGKFIFIEQRATLVLGFLPQELIGASMYEYYHEDDILHLTESHKRALASTERVKTKVYRFRAKEENYVRLQSEWMSFRNPWSKDIEYLVAKNLAILNNDDDKLIENSVVKQRCESSSVQGNYDYFAQNNVGLERLISSHVEVSKIGKKIYDEFINCQKRQEDSSSIDNTNPPLENICTLTAPSSTSTMIISSPCLTQYQSEISSENSSSNPTSNYTSHISTQLEDDMMGIISGPVISESSNALPSEGNDEATMSMFMNLLEADAGLGGPADFTGLPWPLP
ncbi:aryl hydrocarbon receptor nuclear translocator-like protein 1 isoform X2 [Aphidius gifuensis]|uniref:aryl hydrocarbon receptor nuclear translocator-like protein 1 isoform X2 n=1 Tax=Aphidius gifuensis TaxID=684658 RepID=UPI001CDCFA26|nr:aryl hydrocarbon receptor nuclear translocator-like protein 1 isoform X2 [Aphidius gifuensis]